MKYARAALEIDPDALDGYLLLAEAQTDDAERLAILTTGADRGRKIWAEQMRRPAQAWFWADTETRPFLRLVHHLALALWEMGDRNGAIREAKLLLRLNRNDNQGIRDLLAAWYPATGDWDALAKLLHRYREDCTVSHHYSRWLLAFVRGDDTAAALADALEVNPHVPGFLADPKIKPDDDGPLSHLGYVAAGSAGEAWDFADAARDGWSRVTGAIDRLVIDAKLAAE